MGYSPEAVAPTKSCIAAKSTQHTQRCNLGAQGHSSNTVGVPARQAPDNHRCVNHPAPPQGPNSTSTKQRCCLPAAAALQATISGDNSIQHQNNAGACLLRLHSNPTAPSLPSTALPHLPLVWAGKTSLVLLCCLSHHTSGCWMNHSIKKECWATAAIPKFHMSASPKQVHVQQHQGSAVGSSSRQQVDQAQLDPCAAPSSLTCRCRGRRPAAPQAPQWARVQQTGQWLRSGPGRMRSLSEPSGWGLQGQGCSKCSRQVMLLLICTASSAGKPQHLKGMLQACMGLSGSPATAWKAAGSGAQISRSRKHPSCSAFM